MAAANRANVFTAAQKVVKKHYSSAGLDKRPLLEQMVFAALLENAPRKVAEDCFSSLQREYFDWNEVRVTSVAELTELMPKHPTPEAAGTRAKQLLQNVFEAIYSFDLELLKKGNQGKAVAQIEKYGATPFIVSYVTQHALGGHAIPVDKALLDLMVVLGAITEKESEKGAVPGIERAIPKTKGIEFADMIHELAVDFQGSPFSKKIRDIILEISPDAKARFPKRGADESAAAVEAPQQEAATESPKRKTTKNATPQKEAPQKPSAKANKSAPKKKTAKAAPEQTPAKKKTTKKTAATKTATAKKSTRGITKKKPK